MEIRHLTAFDLFRLGRGRALWVSVLSAVVVVSTGAQQDMFEARISVTSSRGAVVHVTQHVDARYAGTRSIASGAMAPVEVTWPEEYAPPVIPDAVTVQVSYGDGVPVEGTAAPMLFLVVRPESSTSRTTVFAIPTTSVRKDDLRRVTMMTTTQLSRPSIGQIVSRMAEGGRFDATRARVFVGILREVERQPRLYLAEVR